MLSVGFLYIAFIMLRCVPLNPIWSYMVSVPVGIHAVEGEFNPDETRVEGNLLAQTIGKI